MDKSSLLSHPRYALVEEFDRFGEYAEEKISRGIEENRKGWFSLRFTDCENNRIFPEEVTVRQKSHEFKFGCTLFLLDGFDTDEKNEQFRDAFLRLFNYGVLPLYWDTLEPERGKPRFAVDSEKIHRRPPLDGVVSFCKENSVRMKGHCLVYNSFNPKWLPNDNRLIDVEIDKRIRTLGERYRYDFEDMDVINEMFSIYKNCYTGNGMRDLQATDESDHEKRCFSLAKQHFPATRLFWNEGCFETFGKPQYNGTRSIYYLMLRRQLALGTPIEGIGMQFHAFTPRESEIERAGVLYNPLRAVDVLERYSDFGLPIHLSEVSVPSWSNDERDEEIQALLVKRMMRLWFSQKNVESVVWWNLVDGTAYAGENEFFAGLLRNDMTPKAAYKALDELINREWHTEFTKKGTDERFVFNGFYGDYEVSYTYNGRMYKKDIRLFRDTTGYDNRLSDFRITTV